MIDVAFTEPEVQVNQSAGPKQRDAHVVRYMRHRLHQLRDGRRSRENANRYDQAVSDLSARPAFLDSMLAKAVTDARTVVTDAQQALASARTRKAKTTARRLLKVATVRLTRAQEAADREAKSEKLAPAVQRRAIIQDGVVLRDARIDVPKGKRAELQPALERLHTRRSITVEQFAAGCRYRAAWELAHEGLYPAGIGEGTGGAAGSGNSAMENAVASGAELNAARHAIGVGASALLQHVIIESLTLESWAFKQGCNAQVVKGHFISALNHLIEHWKPRRRERVAQPIVYIA